jgi:hypothetical protein
MTLRNSQVLSGRRLRDECVAMRHGRPPELATPGIIGPGNAGWRRKLQSQKNHPAQELLGDVLRETKSLLTVEGSSREDADRFRLGLLLCPSTHCWAASIAQQSLLGRATKRTAATAQAKSASAKTTNENFSLLSGVNFTSRFAGRQPTGSAESEENNVGVF